jgi:hypothetical protein
MLYIAALSLTLVAFGHSYFGERLLLRPLFSSDALDVFRNQSHFAKNVLRAGWHILSATWLGMAIVLAMAETVAMPAYIALCTIMFGLFGIGALIASRGRHLSWIFFFIISLSCGAHLLL